MLVLAGQGGSTTLSVLKDGSGSRLPYQHVCQILIKMAEVFFSSWWRIREPCGCAISDTAVSGFDGVTAAPGVGDGMNSRCGVGWSDGARPLPINALGYPDWTEFDADVARMRAQLDNAEPQFSELDWTRILLLAEIGFASDLHSAPSQSNRCIAPLLGGSLSSSGCRTCGFMVEVRGRQVERGPPRCPANTASPVSDMASRSSAPDPQRNLSQSLPDTPGGVCEGPTSTHISSRRRRRRAELVVDEIAPREVGNRQRIVIRIRFVRSLGRQRHQTGGDGRH